MCSIFMLLIQNLYFLKNALISISNTKLSFTFCTFLNRGRLSLWNPTNKQNAIGMLNAIYWLELGLADLTDCSIQNKLINWVWNASQSCLLVFFFAIVFFFLNKWLQRLHGSYTFTTSMFVCQTIQQRRLLAKT